MILHITTQMELIKLDKSIVLKRQKDGKITLWQLARIYIYTLPFATLDMILKNANFQMPFLRDKMPKLQGGRGKHLFESPMFICSFIHCSPGYVLNS
jgi:hypothetical protein